MEFRAVFCLLTTCKPEGVDESTPCQKRALILMLYIVVEVALLVLPAVVMRFRPALLARYRAWSAVMITS